MFKFIPNKIAQWLAVLDRQSIRLILFTLATAVMLLMVSWFPLSLMGFLGLMPSLVVIIIEARKSLVMFRTVLPLNVLAVAWVYSDIFRQLTYGTTSATEIVKTSVYWYVILGMVFVSLMLYSLTPHIVRAWYVFKINSEIKLLHARRSKLRKTWGGNVVTDLIEEEGVGSELVDFLVRNNLMEDLEGNLVFGYERRSNEADDHSVSLNVENTPIDGDVSQDIKTVPTLEIPEDADLDLSDPAILSNIKPIKTDSQEEPDQTK